MKTIAVRRAGGGIQRLAEEVRRCTACAAYLPFGPRPVLQVDGRARILVAGQAPGRKVHACGVPFDDASGERLRQWMGIDREVFYDASIVAVLPMGFCYPGTGTSGDLPPRPECAPLWRAKLLAAMPQIELTLVIGAYAIDWHLPGAVTKNLTAIVKAWRDHRPAIAVLPHPSPRNNLWLRKNPWFAGDVVPALAERVRAIVGSR